MIRFKNNAGIHSIRFFEFFKKKRTTITEKELKMNKIWELWAEDHVVSPYAELMTYQSEVNNGGHAQYFNNVLNSKNIQKELSSLQTVLPIQLKGILKKAYFAYLALEENDDEQAEEILKQCDSAFYENEEKINRLLEEYTEKMKL